MKNNPKLISIFILVVSFLLLGYVYPQIINASLGWLNGKLNLNIPRLPQISFRLGLDLLGGAHLVYEADLSKLAGSDRGAAMDGVRDVIERRVNLFGVSEPVVQISGDNRLIVELAGIQDINQAIELIGLTPFLEFKTPLSVEESAGILKSLLNQETTAALTPETLCVNPQLLIAFLLQYGTDPCYQPSQLTGRHLKRTQVAFEQQLPLPEVSLELTNEGAELFEQITRKYVGKIVAIYLDGQPISLPVVQTEITQGRAVISGNFTIAQAQELVQRMNAGALPVPISLISQQSVGASLGAESVQASVNAGVWGLVLVGLFMILFYRVPGLLSVVALGVYVIVVLTIYKLLPVTLTLAGIAGFILTLGMAVDANVLIFARLREELKSGRNLAQSVEEGFRRAWLSIRDSHVTTLLSALVLYVFTTSIVKGFALTLGIGAIVSLFTSTVLTRGFLRAFVGAWSEKRKWLFG